jgi:hypothetical protein
MPENLRIGRNRAIKLSLMEVICCFLSLAFYMRRRSRIILVLIIGNAIATILGFISKMRLSYCGLLAHAMYTISVIGGLYIYIFIDNAFRETPGNESGSLSQTIIMVITSLPLLGLFVMGIYSCVLAIMIEDELDARQK